VAAAAAAEVDHVMVLRVGDVAAELIVVSQAAVPRSALYVNLLAHMVRPRGPADIKCTPCHRLPRHRASRNSRSEGSKCVSMTRRAISGCPYAAGLVSDMALHPLDVIKTRLQGAPAGVSIRVILALTVTPSGEGGVFIKKVG